MGPYKKNLQVTIYFYQYGVEPIVSPSSSPIAQVCLSLFFFSSHNSNTSTNITNWSRLVIGYKGASLSDSVAERLQK